MAAINEQERSSMWETAKGIGQSYINPVNWFRYNPGIYQPLKGRMQIPVGPFGGFGLGFLKKKYGTDIPVVGRTAYMGYGGPNGGFGFYMDPMTQGGKAAAVAAARNTPGGGAAAQAAAQVSMDQFRTAMSGKDDVAKFLAKKYGYLSTSKTKSTREVGMLGAPQGPMVPYKVMPVATIRSGTLSTRVARFTSFTDITPRMLNGQGATLALTYNPMLSITGPTTKQLLLNKPTFSMSSLASKTGAAARRTISSVKDKALGLAGRGITSFGSKAAYFAPRAGMVLGMSALKAWSVWEVTKLAASAFTFGAESIGRGIVGTVDNAMGALQQNKEWEFGGNLALTYLNRGAATERQRAIQAISKSRLNARAGLGNEASGLHQ